MRIPAAIRPDTNPSPVNCNQKWRMKFPCLATYRHCRSKSASAIQAFCASGGTGLNLFFLASGAFGRIRFTDQNSSGARKDENEVCQNDSRRRVVLHRVEFARSEEHTSELQSLRHL